MRPNATDRLVVALATAGTCALIAVLAGMAEVALFAAPWVVLLVLGSAGSRQSNVQAKLAASSDRVVIGDNVELEVELVADESVQVAVAPSPDAAFGSHEGPPVVVEAVTPGGSTNVTFDFTARQWGAHDLGRVQIEARSAYGLTSFRGDVSQNQTVRVHPTPQQLRALLSPVYVRRLAGVHRSREAARGVEYADLREFSAGDSVRDINWRASARSADLWVSQRHPDRTSNVVLLVDSFIDSGHQARDAFGLVVEAAIALSESHLAATDQVGMVEFGGVIRWLTPGTGESQLQRLTDALLNTRLYQSAAEKELPVLPPRALPPRSFVIAFSPMLDDRFIEALFTTRARGHDVAVVEVMPPGVREPDGVDSQARRLARTMWEAERAVARDRLARQGVAVSPWDGEQPIDVTLNDLLRRRRLAKVRAR